MNILNKEYPKIGRINRRVLIVTCIIICVLFFLAFLRGVGNQGAKRTVQERKSSTSAYNDWIPDSLTYSDVLHERKLPGYDLKPSNNAELEALRKELDELKKKLSESDSPGKHAAIVKNNILKNQALPKLPPAKPDKSNKKDEKFQQEAFGSEIFYSNKSSNNSIVASLNPAAGGGEVDQAKQRLAQLQSQLAGGGGVGSIGERPDLSELGLPGFGGEDELISQNNQKEKREFLEKSLKHDVVYNKDKLHTPISPYELKAGSTIPCTLITGLNSDLPGSIAAQVRETVYDTVSGEYILIPQGSRMIGSYDSIITYGQERTLIVFNRIIMPNGNSISLEKFQGIDLQGYSGLKDKINNHWFKILGSVVVSGILQGLADMTEDVDEIGLNDGEIVANSVSAEVAKTAAKIINKQINIQPTLEVRPGWNFNVFVEKDLILTEYKG